VTEPAATDISSTGLVGRVRRVYVTPVSLCTPGLKPRGYTA
jgi:hypothetical protein